MSIRNQTKGVEMKKVALTLAVILGFAVAQPVQAAPTDTIAIIDTAIDSSKNKNVVYEVCITNAKTCSNKTNFQEGPGAAAVADWKVKGVEHGYNVAQAAVLTNPNIKIVFIRISDINVHSATFSAMHNAGESLSRAIEWVSNNASRLNIKSVSISQASGLRAENLKPCTENTVVIKSVESLKQQNVPVFAATGNDKSTTAVGFPACVAGVIGVGALKPNLEFASYSNVGPGLDLVARGDINVIDYFGVKRTLTGTSIATPVASTLATTRKLSGSWDELISSLPKAQGYAHIA
jgi:hypothetical protein